MEMHLPLSGTELVCPRLHGESGQLTINIERIMNAEHRLHEVERVTQATAFEQLGFWRQAWRDAYEVCVAVTHQKAIADRAANKIRGRILLDEAPEVLKAKGLSSAKSPAGNEDLREAVLAVNEEYQEALSNLDYLTAITEYLKGKVKVFEKAYFDIKDYRNGNIPPRNLSGGVDAVPVTQGRAAFGEPSYG